MGNDVVINVKTKFNNKGFKKAKRETKRLTDNIKTSFASIKGVVAGVGFAAAIGIGKESIDLFREQAKVEAQLNAVLESTGGAAGITATEVKRLASNLQGVTNFGDEATIAGANLLLTFRDIGSNVFPRATESMLNMSAALNQGIKESAIQLGKALNDPIKGITALSRVGIQFTDQQKEQIKILQNNNQLFEAQTIILDELEAQFGGSARAAREADGNIIALGNAVGDLKEVIGEELVRGMSDFNAEIIKAIEGLIKAKGAFDLVRDATEKQKSGLDDDTLAFLKFAESIPMAGNIVKLAQMIGNVVAPTEEFTEAITEAGKEQEKFNSVVAKTEQVVQVNEEFIKAQRDLAQELISIDQDATEENEKIWTDFLEAKSKLFEDFQKEINSINTEGEKEQLKNAKSLAKALADIDKDLTKSLAKENSREQKDIKKKRDSFAKDTIRNEKRRQIDTLADQRLFDFELRNLAADGQGNRIRELLERREIEEQIDKEKQELEKSIGQEKFKDEIEVIRETAQERRDQLIQDAAEERERKQQDAVEEKIRLEEELQERRVAASENFREQLDDLEKFKTDKLAANEASRLENVAALGRELAESETLLESELEKMVVIAGKLGLDAGLAFAEGMSEGAATNELVQQFLGNSPSLRGGAPRGEGRNFAHGGSFIVGGSGGTDSQAVAFNATPGEQVTVSTPQQQGGGITVNVNGIGGQDLADFLDERMSGLIQEFQDNHLIPALSGQ